MNRIKYEWYIEKNVKSGYLIPKTIENTTAWLQGGGSTKREPKYVNIVLLTSCTPNLEK